jgi:hypothetical protein
MRSSLKAVCEALAEADASQLPVDSNKLRRSNWLKHTACILDGSVTIIRNVHIYSSHVLIHCSDGWDRTSQLSAIAQLCLDPYFRTLEGFKVLVEKDWLSFGHMFLQRSGHLSSDKLFTATPDNLDADEESDDEFGVAVKGVQAFFGSVSKQFQSNSHIKEVSPVFHQFLDCVRQIQRQFPDRFEFNEDYLIDLHYHLYACQFGTFMFDSERQRRTGAKPYTDRTVSAWEWFDLPAQRARYLHKGYRPELDDRTSRASDADLGVLLPDPRDVAFWHRLFKRSDEEMNPPESRFLDTAAGTPVAPEPPLLAAEDRMMSDDAVPSLSAVSASAASLASISTAASASGPASGTVSVSGSTGSTPALTPSATGRKQWNWSQLGNGLGTGALSAFNQFKASASDALTQLRESADAAAAGSVAGADEMSAREREREYAPGTGIGEGRGPSAGLPRTPLRVPSEANPWSDKPVSVSASAKKDKEEKGSEPPSVTVTTSASTSTSTTASTPRTAGTWDIISPERERERGWGNTNPWGEDRPNLHDLSLEDMKQERGSGTKAAAKQSADNDKDDKALVDAAMGGDSKAWDPLGAL